MKQFIEIVENVTKMQILKTDNATIYYGINNDVLELYSLRVSSKNRNKGYAKEIMTMLCNIADDKNLTIIVGVSPLDHKTKLDKLVSFYKTFNFALTGKSINVLGHPEMIRFPKI